MAMRGLDPSRAEQDAPATAAATPDQAERPATDANPPTPRARPALLTRALGRPAGAGNPWRWFFSGIWLVYLVAPVWDLFGHGHGVLWIAGGLAIAIAFCALYLPVLVNCDGRPRLARAGLVALAALAALACVVYGKGWTPLWIYVSAAVGMVLTAAPDGRRQAMRGVLAVGACYVLFSWLSHDDPTDFLVVLLPVLLVGVTMIGFRMQIQLMHELTQARETVAKLAAGEERLRLARDMHDLTGQSLSMITLKSELAAKRLARLEPSAERDTVLGDLGDIGRVSRQTLHDIREAVSGYRRPTLAIEAITAQNALEAAGIRLDDDPGLTLRSGTFDADAEAVLAWCLREAVTNVIRHSGARACRIRLIRHPGELSLEISDDGRGPADQNARDPGAPSGAGLRGMSERLGTVGGRLSLAAADPGPVRPANKQGPGNRPGNRQGFKLTATVPVDHYDA
jgi:two-component system, NarL family, sensor histidine kinase DesK